MAYEASLNSDISKVRRKKPALIIPWNNGKWGPEGWFRYKVRYGDNWWSVANKDGWSDPMDLIEYNFKTRNPKEVNWYLRNFVGCKYATQDGKNHVFSDNLNPGYIYTAKKLQEQEPPPVSHPIPWPSSDDSDEVNLKRPGLWYGVGVKGGAFAGLGYERTEALMFSSDFTDVYSLGIDTMKFGGGAGLGGAAVLVVASGLPTLKDLKYCRVTGRDWGLSIGLRFKALAQTAAGLGGIKKLIHGVKYGEIGGKALSEGATSLKYVSGLMSSCELGTMPTVTVVEIPFAGLGVEISLYSASSTFSVRTVRESDATLLQDVADSLLKIPQHA
jgi:hypothetical protein